MLPVQRLGRLSRAAAEVRVTELLDNFGLAAEAERQLSGGQNQRVATRAGAYTLSRFVDWRTCQYHRNLHLSIRDVPVSLEKRSLVRWRDQLEAVARVEANCPIRSFPGANQDAPRAQLPQMRKESSTNSAPLAARQDVSVTKNRRHELTGCPSRPQGCRFPHNPRTPRQRRSPLQSRPKPYKDRASNHRE